MEFAAHGNLRDYLRSKRLSGCPLPSFAESSTSSASNSEVAESVGSTTALPLHTMYDYGLQVSRGMEYLMSQRVGTNTHINNLFGWL